ncbi:toll/interleukin-1 receptor domain-containing protein [Gillisia sp. Hel_I_29]|uniref:toll/interleukin-1 receptor domain-containing protein n=1 Tax=Gillisia sp. Hel_I_29 TaxID=1249975 RepID=UPI00069221D2|nr:TIR domain-containing protein [Gillisia sp. Hel_I_29]
MPTKQPPISSDIIENICRVIANTETGLTGTEIGRILAESNIPDTDPKLTKWKRLFNAFGHYQNKHNCSNNILTFLSRAMKPVRYVDNPELFKHRLLELNKRLCFIGLELTEKAQYRKIEKTSTITDPFVDLETKSSNEYDIAISFAGEDRKIAEEIAEKLNASGIKVFYDAYEKATLWGKDLYEHLNDVYKNKATFCLMVISTNYREKQWTNHERKAAQARAFSQNKEYILPLKLDDTEIPGLNETIGYVDLRNSDANEIVGLLKSKLKE